MATLFVQCGGPSEDAVEQNASAVRLTKVGVQTVQAAPFAHTFAVQGNVETDRIANILAEFPGVVREVFVVEGTQVNQGDALVRIDTDVLAKQREELLTQFELAETLFERQERLWNKDIGSEVDFLQAKTSLEALTRSLATLDEQIGKAVIRAPFNGVLDRVFVNVGEMASAPMPVVRVVDLSDLYVRASVSDHYAGVVMAGQPVTVEAQGLEPIESQVRRVGQFIEAANRTIDVTIDLPSGTRALPNMVATVHITDLALDSALALPSAVVQQDANGQEYVFVIKGDQATKQTVKTGVMSDGLLLIESGLKAGDRVIKRGAARVVDGERVTLIES
ncbi:efflux RND transporter periplasmic adaptor subunit [Flavobacteriales bacterium]|nr:efflux RND transporter periplasmic adaptor subunit [Flavobacteriales bacterium]